MTLGFNQAINEKMTEQCIGNFEKIRQNVDNIFMPWLFSPEHEEIAELRETMRALAGRLNTDTAVNDKTSTYAMFTGDVGDVVRADYLTGGAWEVLRSRFLNTLNPSLALLRDLGIFLGAIVGAEENLWKEASSAVLEIAQQGTNAANALLGQGAWNAISVSLDVAGWILTGVGFVIPGTGAVGGALKFGSLGIDILKSVAPESKALKEGCASADEIQQSMKKLVQELSHRIQVQEENLAHGISDMVRHIGTSEVRDLIDTSLPAIHSTDGSTVRVGDVPKARSLAMNRLPNIANHLEMIAKDSGTLSLAGRISRDPRIGLGSRGPAGEWTSLQNMWAELIRNLAWDTAAAGKNIGLALDALELADDSARSRLADYARQIDGMNPYDPWVR